MDVINAVAPWEGQLYWIGNIREGVSQNGNAYAFADFTLKYQNHQMQERYITFSISGAEKVANLKNIRLGSAVRVSWFPDASEYTPQGGQTRWYPSFQAYNVSPIQPRVQQQQVVQQQPAYGAQPTQLPQQTPAFQGGYAQQPQQYQQPAIQQPAPVAPQYNPTPQQTDDLPF